MPEDALCTYILNYLFPFEPRLLNKPKVFLLKVGRIKAELENLYQTLYIAFLDIDPQGFPLPQT